MSEHPTIMAARAYALEIDRGEVPVGAMADEIRRALLDLATHAEHLTTERDRMRAALRDYEEDCASLPEDIGVTEYVHAMTEECRRLTEACDLYGGDVAVLSRELADACEAMGLTDDIDTDRFKFAAQARALVAERDRLARILAVERGDESAAPDGWRFSLYGVWRRKDPRGGSVDVTRATTRGWGVVPVGRLTVVDIYPTALEAIEAADAARGGDDG